ncbi:uncharacterized protein [Drosophila tropicalis]|uniref:uncharacterized protein n=1 Tax=Drosophila tropicalis TaxID=46794 RepID=UPI0035AC280C
MAKMSSKSTAQRRKHFDENRNKSGANNNNHNKNNNKPADSPRLQKSMERLQVQQPNVNRRAAGSNWLAATAPATVTASGSENQLEQKPNPTSGVGAPDGPPAMSKSAHRRLKKNAERNRYLAMDCEMVGVGFNGNDDMLARVSIVNRNGDVLLDKHVKPFKEVTDYRTSVSGIRPQDIANGEDFAAVQDEVVKLLHGKILVGHALRNDLNVLNIKHPYEHIRDTSRYKPLSKLVSNGHTPSLKRLTMAVLGQEIQTGEHNSVEDARAAMGIFNRIAVDWEKYLEKQQQQHHHHHYHGHHK